jgi:hypothetical protein
MIKSCDIYWCCLWAIIGIDKNHMQHGQDTEFLYAIIDNIAALLVGGSRDRSPVISLGIFSVVTDGTMCPAVD